LPTERLLADPPPAADASQTRQANRGSVARGRTMRRWSIAIPNKLACIAHPPDGHPEPGVADIGVPVHIGLRQRLPRTPLMGNREIVRALKRRGESRLGLGDTCGSSDPGQRDAARQHCNGKDPLWDVADVHGLTISRGPEWILNASDPRSRETIG